MKRMFFAVVGILFFSAVLGVTSGRSADVPTVPQAADKAVEKAKAEVLKTDDKDKKEPLDINTASEKELADLKGIDKEQAKKIIKNRPYARKDELVSKKVIGEKAYDRIKDQIIAKQVKEIVDINSASEKEIAAIKGIDQEQAKKIVKNRPYARKDELVSKKILDEKTYDKVKDQLIAKQSKEAAAKDAGAKAATDVKGAVSGAVDSLKK